MPIASLLSEETILRAQIELQSLRQQGDFLAQQLATNQSVGQRSLPAAGRSDGATRRSVERDGFSVGRSHDRDLLRAIAAEDERIAADLARMRAAAEEAAARREEEAQQEELRKAEMSRARQELEEAARARRASCCHP